MNVKENWVGDVLRYWYEDLEPAAWYSKAAALDADIRTRFADLHARLAVTSLLAAEATPEAALATVIVLDQFPRNMYRGTPRMFATDAAALAIAQEAIRRGLDRTMTSPQREFLYMPFQHSEDTGIQARSVELFTALADAVALDYARRHKEIVDRFGRFPHRNAVLGRTTTPAEEAFLKEPNSSF